MTTGDRGPQDSLEEPDAAVSALFGARLDLARRYAELLAGDGVDHGLIGPREIPRLWDRHLANSALVADLLPQGARVVDVGSGAGLPGVPLALRRPDLHVDLVEPMLRRTTFLERVVSELDLAATVRVVRGRADETGTRQIVGDADWVVARAVAPLDRLVRWCLPLLRIGGTLLAVKGSSAAAELSEHGPAIAGFGATSGRVVELGSEGLSQTWVISVDRSGVKPRRTTKGRR